MSKYYKVEDVEAVMADKHMNRPLDSDRWVIGDIGKSIADLPTIEVSEDCISKHDIWKIIEDNAYWVRYNENSTEKGMTLTGINQALNECPPVIPTVSEDCISREWVKGICENMLDEEMLEHMLGYIEDAPSVVPTIEPQTYITEDRDTQILDAWQVHHRNAPTVKDEPTTEQSSVLGEWIETPDGTMCGNCNKFPYDDGEYHIANWHSDYCPNCGAKMRLE